MEAVLAAEASRAAALEVADAVVPAVADAAALAAEDFPVAAEDFPVAVPAEAASRVVVPVADAADFPAAVAVASPAAAWVEEA